MAKQNIGQSEKFWNSFALEVDALVLALTERDAAYRKDQEELNALYRSLRSALPDAAAPLLLQYEEQRNKLSSERMPLVCRESARRCVGLLREMGVL